MDIKNESLSSYLVFSNYNLYNKNDGKWKGSVQIYEKEQCLARVDTYIK